MPVSARALALVCPLLLLSGCNGLGVFLDDTHSPTDRVNAPLDNSETSRRVQGKEVEIEAMGTQKGNVWPGPLTPQPTLEDLEREPPKPLPDLEGSTPPAISNVPNLVIPTIPHHLQPRSDNGAGLLNGPIEPGLPPVNGSAVINTPNPSTAPQTDTTSTLGITVPNGNGTSTVIAPDGTISTIKTPPPSPPPH
jgi:hypothetical protein